MYEPRFGRWLSHDPKGQFFSPYVGMGNNPINGIDPDGGLFGKLRAQRWAKKYGGEAYYDKVTKTWWGEKNGFRGANVFAKNFGSQGFGLGLFNKGGIFNDGKSFHIEGEVTFGGQAGVEFDNVVDIEANLASFRLFGWDKTLTETTLSVLHHDLDAQKGEWMKSKGFEVKNAIGIKLAGILGSEIESSQILVNRGQDIVSKNWQRKKIIHKGIINKTETDMRTGEIVRKNEFALGAKLLIGVELKISYK